MRPLTEDELLRFNLVKAIHGKQMSSVTLRKMAQICGILPPDSPAQAQVGSHLGTGYGNGNVRVRGGGDG